MLTAREAHKAENPRHQPEGQQRGNDPRRIKETTCQGEGCDWYSIRSLFCDPAELP